MTTVSIVNWKKIAIYTLLAFGISWSVALIMRVLDVPYGGLWSLIIIGGLYMPGPAFAAFIMQKFIYKQPMKEIGWTFSIKNYKQFLAVFLWFFALLSFVFAIVALFGNTGWLGKFGQLDFSTLGFGERFQALVSAKVGSSTSIKIPTIPGWLFFIISMVQAIFAALTVNLPFMFGEEFGWRGMLLKETQNLGFLKSSLLIGVLWGLWHMPIVMLGHNYPNHPYFGIIMMCFMTTSLAPVFSYVRIKTKSIVGPCILHGLINATGSLYALYIINPDELYSSITGWAGVGAGIIITCGIYIFDKKIVGEFSTCGKQDSIR